MGSNGKVQTSRLYNIFSAVLGFIMWGGWAYYINGGHGIGTRITAGLAQGTATFVITLFMIKLVTFFYMKLPGFGIFRLILPSVFTIAITGTCLTLIHVCIGTPNIFLTVAPALTMAFLFCLYTTFKLKRPDKNR